MDFSNDVNIENDTNSVENDIVTSWKFMNPTDTHRGYVYTCNNDNMVWSQFSLGYSAIWFIEYIICSLINEFIGNNAVLGV